MTGFDYAVLIVIGLSIVISMARGAVQEILSLLSWCLIVWAANHYTDQVSRWLPFNFSTPEMQILVSFFSLLLTLWFAAIIIRAIIAQLIHKAGLNRIDRALGMIVGFLKGNAIILAIVLIAGFTRFPQLPMWRNALLSATFVSVALEILPWLPPTLASKVHY